MSIAADLRGAAAFIACRTLSYSEADKLAARLRVHANTIERVEKEMRPYENLEGPIANWYDALKGETT